MLIETVASYEKMTADSIRPAYAPQKGSGPQDRKIHYRPVLRRSHTFRQVMRFALAGGLNTLLDILILNALLWRFPTNNAGTLLTYNSIAYSIGAINSFLLNKYWTFGHKQRTTRAELARFTLVTLCGIAWSSIILWLASLVLHASLSNATIWANASKLIAIAGTALISYLGMRLWVFVSKKSGQSSLLHQATSAPVSIRNHRHLLPISEHQENIVEREPRRPDAYANNGASKQSTSVVLPAYNEEQVIASTILHVWDALSAWCIDFEIIVVNDGSTDRTGAIVSALAETSPRIRLVTHPTNQGYGAALVSGFAAASKQLTMFMDSDGQFDIHDLQRFLMLIDEYDAVIGYRLHRQDSWMRKLNAWGWQCLVGFMLDIHVRDIDCAFKLLHTTILHQYPLETRGAMINAELLYRLKRAGYTCREVGVHHLPRQGGRATGANVRVIVRAFRELFVYARKWQCEGLAQTQPLIIPDRHPL